MFFSLSVFFVSAQITPPGYEREMAEMKGQKRGNILDQDSIIVVEKFAITDMETGVDKMQVSRTKMSLRYYCIKWLGIQDPNVLLNGQPMKIVNPETYDEMMVQLNKQTHQIDTIR